MLEITNGEPIGQHHGQTGAVTPQDIPEYMMDEISSIPDDNPVTQNSPSENGQPISSGEVSPQDPNVRSPMIPRDRFDQTLARAQRAEEQLQTLLTHRYQQEMNGQNPAIPTMESGATLSEPAPDVPIFPDFTNPEVKEHWEKQVLERGIAGVGELLEIKEAEMMNKFSTLLDQYVQPIQHSAVEQQLEQYERSRASDPRFHEVHPTFRRVVDTVVANSNGQVNLKPRSLRVLEHFAAAIDSDPSLQGSGAAQTPAAMPHNPMAMPYTEAPGPALSTGFRPASGHATDPRVKEISKFFGSSESDYAKALKAQEVM